MVEWRVVFDNVVGGGCGSAFATVLFFFPFFQVVISSPILSRDLQVAAGSGRGSLLQLASFVERTLDEICPPLFGSRVGLQLLAPTIDGSGEDKKG